ncbi:hypothetical protein BJ875DRAFT_508153 [Amylocarpus encephaloides]|uniref:Nephrocystin 3-like N-terminal domain-containing protein n=1 Tax=Amylocarpus encephaloides TaxID=45428 RepID=A0A9P7Y9S8_9HELO|nr:hypothetical protein BJ875DRAFT_508153 [Amylocarpus encephaloides]
MIGIATKAEVKGLEEGIREMKELPSSFQEEAGGVNQTNRDGSDNFTNVGLGTMKNYKAAGNMHFDDLSQQTDSQNRSCLQALRTTDPHVDKKCIEQTKGGLLKDSYIWILENYEFRRWQNNTSKQSRLLWIRGDPGKGKTMRPLLVALSYFFCQATDPPINSATAVLRGLIYLLVDQQPALLKHVRMKYDDAGKELFSTYVIIDALDEYVTGLLQLLRFFDETSPAYPRLNQDSISAAVKTYIEHKVGELAKRKKYNAKLECFVRNYLSSNTDATFLWVALVLQALETIDRRNTHKRVREFPPGLGPLYRQMMDQICESDQPISASEYSLSIVAVVYRPMTLRELVSLDDELVSLNDELHKLDNVKNLPEDIKNLERTVGQCRSFLTIRESTVYFIHQSAKDFLYQENASRELFPSRVAEVHYTVFSRSLQIMSRAPRLDIYSLRTPGISIDQIKPPNPDPLAAVRNTLGNNLTLEDGGLLEALSLMGSLSNGIVTIRKLKNWLEAEKCPHLYAFVHDAKRFVLHNTLVIEQAPLQLYCSAIIFTPAQSIVRVAFENCIPSWIQKVPKVQERWDALQQTLEGHSSSVNSVAFSPDGKHVTLEGHSSTVNSVAFSPNGKHVVSGSYDKTVRLWDAATGAPLQTLEGHSNWVNSVAFSPDGKLRVLSVLDNWVYYIRALVWETLYY